MRRDDFEALAKKMKKYELDEAAQRIMPGIPVIIRLDGNKFSKFTRGLRRPYDERLSLCMIETTKALVEFTKASVGYTQSDEITLGFPCLDPERPLDFDGRIQKLCSLYAAKASRVFGRQIDRNIPEKAHLDAIFDARIFGMPNLDLAVENFLWRETDATRNSLTMAAQAFYSHKELNGVNEARKHDFLFQKGVNWNDYPAFFKRGTYVRRQTVVKEIPAEKLARIPEGKRPQGPVERKVVDRFDMPPLSMVSNAKEVLFYGAEPLTAGDWPKGK